MPTNEQRRNAAKRKLERQLVKRQQAAKVRRQRTIIASIIAGLIVVGGAIWLITKKPSETDSASSGTDSSATTESTPATPCTYTATTEKTVKAVNLPENTNPLTTGEVTATISLTQGDLPVTLDRALAPCAVNAFISLATQKFYDDSPCFRITTDDDFKILQCGDPSGTGRGGPGYSYSGETNPVVTAPETSASSTDAASTGTESTASESIAAETSDATTSESVNQYPVGTIAMANVTPGGENGSQFFIVYGETNLGSEGYTKIGTVSADGIAVIEQIAAKGTVVGKNPNGAKDAPTETVTITSVSVPEDAVTPTETPTVETTDPGIDLSTDPGTVPSETVPTDEPTDAVTSDGQTNGSEPASTDSGTAAESVETTTS